ncbi:MAG: sulfatase-like hydrolase/transferase [Planctomycetes bacterium]|nr:sulfatase-like hydrolase/transferase [Planctomycetota bacterium]
MSNYCIRHLFRLATTTLTLLFGVGLLSNAQGVELQDKPNIVFLLADDLGYGDLACFGSPVIQSPNLDQLADQGMKLNQCYAASPNCSPSRAGILTGRSPYRVGMYDFARLNSFTSLLKKPPLPNGSRQPVTRRCSPANGIAPVISIPADNPILVITVSTTGSPTPPTSAKTRRPFFATAQPPEKSMDG